MSVKREQLFTDLEALSEEQIEVGLEAGVWGDPARAAVQRYLDQLKLERVEAAASEAARAAIQAALVATEEASKSKLRATVALIFAGGAMVAAMAAAFVAFLALQNWTW
jgi:hypothetical protein